MIAFLGKVVAIIGLLITIIGLIFGFGLMFQGSNDDLAKFFLMVIPIGFVVLFAGFSTVIMFSPRESELHATQQKESKKSVDNES
jgi:ABC-type Na+ efflux pump permease subunit